MGLPMQYVISTVDCDRVIKFIYQLIIPGYKIETYLLWNKKKKSYHSYVVWSVKLVILVSTEVVVKTRNMFCRMWYLPHS